MSKLTPGSPEEKEMAMYVGNQELQSEIFEIYTGFRVKGEKELQSDIFYIYTGFRVKRPIKLEY